MILLLPSAALAQVYHWEDQQGTLYYTNAPEKVPESYRSHVGPLPPAPVSFDAPEEPPPPPRSAGSARIPYVPGEPIFVNARIGSNGALVLILDTGADRTMVAPQALWRLGISTANAPLAEIRGVTGTGQGDVVRISSLEVGEARVGPLRIIALDADLRKADGLLGRDFLEYFTVTIDSR